MFVLVWDKLLWSVAIVLTIFHLLSVCSALNETKRTCNSFKLTFGRQKNSPNTHEWHFCVSGSVRFMSPARVDNYLLFKLVSTMVQRSLLHAFTTVSLMFIIYNLQEVIVVL